MTKSKSTIHPSAIIEPGAQIGNNVTIEPYAVIKSNVIIEDNVTIKSHVYLDGFTTIGEGTVIYPSASIGTKSQDLKFRGEKTFVKIGKNCEIREFVTINSSCQENSAVEIGDNCLLMAYCHVAHNCVLGKRVIMSNSAMLAGHVTVGDFAIIGGMTGVHQFVNIGTHAMIGGMSRITKDISPFTIGGGIPFKFGGLNIIGLKRHGISLETRRELSKMSKLIYRSKLRLEEALELIEKEIKLFPEVLHWIEFCRNSKRGLLGPDGTSTDSEMGDSEENEEKENEKEMAEASK